MSVCNQSCKYGGVTPEDLHAAYSMDACCKLQAQHTASLCCHQGDSTVDTFNASTFSASTGCASQRCSWHKEICNHTYQMPGLKKGPAASSDSIYGASYSMFIDIP